MAIKSLLKAGRQKKQFIENEDIINLDKMD
jgi:hypothetical protein